MNPCPFSATASSHSWPISPREREIAALRREVRTIEGAGQSWDEPPLTTGCRELDNLFAEKGLRRGSLIEWLSAEPGGGAWSLSLFIACQMARQSPSGGRDGAVAMLAEHNDFYPLAALAWGADPQRLILIHTRHRADRLWALDQCLRCPAVAAVWAAVDAIDPHTFRRLQLAAEEGGVIGLLVRDARVRDEPSWSHAQLLVRPLGGPRQPERVRERTSNGRRLQVELLRSRHGVAGQTVELTLDDVRRSLSQAEVPHQSKTPITNIFHHPRSLARRPIAYR